MCLLIDRFPYFLQHITAVYVLLYNLVNIASGISYLICGTRIRPRPYKCERSGKIIIVIHNFIPYNLFSALKSVTANNNYDGRVLLIAN